ncbi:hypothetical protein BJX65DRAFT_295416 [Aspergillus insuetus]
MTPDSKPLHHFLEAAAAFHQHLSAANTVELPFQRESLPSCPLPITEEIRACTNILLNRIYKVVAINDEIVVKYGRTVQEYEGQVLVFLERHFPTPTLTESEKDEIIVKLRETFTNLRQVPCPEPDFFGGLDGGNLHHYFFHNRKADELPCLGPFIGETSFVAGLVDNFRAQVEYNRRPDHKVRFYKKYLPSVLKGHRPTLTHGDVQMKNIMVAESKDQRNEKGDWSFDVVLIWEFFCVSTPFTFMYWKHDWCLRAQELLEAWPAKLGVMRMIDKYPGLCLVYLVALEAILRRPQMARPWKACSDAR